MQHFLARVQRPLPLRKLAVVTATLALLAMTLPAMAEPQTLQYRGSNEWVAVADNAPLQVLVAQAKKGSNQFRVLMPADQPKLSRERLLVLQSILEKYAKGPVVLMVDSQTAASNQLLVEALN